MNTALAQQMFDDIRSRQLPREQYKNKNIKQYNSSSRLSEDDPGSKVSTRPASWPEAVASKPVAETSSSLPLAGTACQGESGSVISPRELASRWSGISVHHVKTKKGVKIGISLQMLDWVSEGRILPITAELKRYDRLREIKHSADDDQDFVEYLDGVKNHLHQSKSKNACLGRAHQRGARKRWIKNTLVLAYMSDHVVKRLYLYIEGEQIEISLDQEMSERQQQTYHSTGYHGKIVLKKKSPSIFDMPTVQYGG